MRGDSGQLVRALLLMIMGCAVTDTLDGHIDDHENCCAALTAQRVRECLAKWAEPGECWEVFCPLYPGRVNAYLHYNGEVTSCPAP